MGRPTGSVGLACVQVVVQMRKLSTTGYGEIEVKSRREAKTLEKILASNPLIGKPTTKIKVRIEGYINSGNINKHDGIGQSFGLEVTKAMVRLK